MIRFVLSVVATAVAFWVVTALFPGLMTYEGDVTGLIVLALIFGVVNGLIGPLVRLLALPLTVVTLGLVGFLVNAALLLFVAWIANELLSINFQVGDFPPDLLTGGTLVAAVVGAIVLGVVNTITHLLVPG
jgi:putative membrane protein